MIYMTLFHQHDIFKHLLVYCSKALPQPEKINAERKCWAAGQICCIIHHLCFQSLLLVCLFCNAKADIIYLYWCFSMCVPRESNPWPWRCECQLSWMPMTWICFQKVNDLQPFILLDTTFFQSKSQKLHPLLWAFRYANRVCVPPILHPPVMSWVISGGVYDSVIKRPEPTDVMWAVCLRATKAAQMSLFRLPIATILQALINRWYALFT